MSEQRTDAEWRAADRRKRINDLAAQYAGQMAAGYAAADTGITWQDIVMQARNLAAAAVDAEEQA